MFFNQQSINLKWVAGFLLLIGLLIFSAASLALSSSNSESSPIITDYHRTFIPVYDKRGNLRIAIRLYYVMQRSQTSKGEWHNKPYYLLVNPYTFATESQPAENLLHRRFSGSKIHYYTRPEITETPYMQALMRWTSPPYKLENYGITHATHAVQGEFLTVDMCPSVKPFEADFFKTLVEKSKGEPLPLALSITGVWMIGHPKEFKWLIQQEKAGKLRITWINHSFAHVFYLHLPFKDNFLLTPETDIESEILDTEKLLLEANQLPSVFFRFPGLISDEKTVLTLRRFGLIPIGSDAWLAKNEQPKPGSIILVHGNSNEPQGIEDIMPLLKKDSLNFLPLDKAF